MALPSRLLVSVGGRRSQRPGPSPTLGSLGPSHHRRHKSRVSLRGPPCAHGVSGIPLERCATPTLRLFFFSFIMRYFRLTDVCSRSNFSLSVCRWISKYEGFGGAVNGTHLETVLFS